MFEASCLVTMEQLETWLQGSRTLVWSPAPLAPPWPSELEAVPVGPTAQAWPTVSTRRAAPVSSHPVALLALEGKEKHRVSSRHGTRAGQQPGTALGTWVQLSLIPQELLQTLAHRTSVCKALTKGDRLVARPHVCGATLPCSPTLWSSQGPPVHEFPPGRVYSDS